MELKLIAFDLDGTVLDQGMELSDQTAHALVRAHELGCILAVTTGRPASLLPNSIKQNPHIDYIISSNGARLTEAKTERVLFQSLLNKHTVLAIMEASGKENAGFNVQFTDKAVFEYRALLELLGFICRSQPKNIKPLFAMMRSIRHVLSAYRLVKGSVTGIEKFAILLRDKSAVEETCDMLRNRYGVEAVAASGQEIEITAAGTSKGATLSRLINMLGIDKMQVVAFGDSGNDLSMRPSVGCFVAMGNASDEVKAVSDYVTKTVSEDGVASALGQMMIGIG